MLLRLSLLTLLIAACGDDDSGQVDGGRDLGLDLGRDLGVDLGRDSGPRDQGAPDQGRDMGPDDPEWVAVWDDLPESCALERAVHPERTLRPVWASCGENCLYLEPDPRLDREYPGYAVGWSDGEDGYFVMRQLPPGGTTADSAYVISVVGPEETVLALRAQPRVGGEKCGWGSFAGHAGEFGTIAHIWRSDVDHEYRATRMTFDGFTEEFPVVPAEDVASSAVQSAVMGSAIYAAEVQPLAQIFAFADGAVTAMGGSLGEVRGIPQTEMAIGDTVLWETWGFADIGLAYGRMDLQGATYLAIEGVRIIGTDVDEDTHTIAWNQGYGYLGSGQYERLELWTAEFTRDPADLEPRLVGELDPHQSSGVVDGGYYARFRSGGFEVIELATGDLRRLRSTEDLALRFQPLWITSTEVAVPATHRATGEATVVRVRLDSLPVEGA